MSLITKNTTYNISSDIIQAVRKITASISDKDMIEKHGLSHNELDLIHDWHNGTFEDSEQ